MQLATYEVTDPTVDSQMIQLKNSGANVFFNITTPKFAAQAIKKAAEIGWKPAHYLNNVSSSVGAVMKPAGFENSPGHHHCALPARTQPTRSGQTPRISWPVEGLHGQVHTQRRSADWHQVYGYAVANLADDGAQAVRRRPHARERHEAGGQPEGRRSSHGCCPASRSTPAPTDFYPHPVGAAGPLQGRDVGAVRRDPVQRERRASRPTRSRGRRTIRRPQPRTASR